MSFRDDRDALGERVHELERELETARREAAERASTAAKVSGLERDLDRSLEVEPHGRGVEQLSREAGPKSLGARLQLRAVAVVEDA